MRRGPRDFDTWFADNHRRVLGAVLIVCAGDIARAEDATNDACIDALAKWDRVGEMQSPTNWVTKVAINRAKRSWLHRRRYVSPVNVDTLDLPLLNDSSNIELWDAVRGLTMRQRSVIVMRYIEGRTQGDIADLLGVAPGTVSATLTQARAKLRVELEGDVQ